MTLKKKKSRKNIEMRSDKQIVIEKPNDLHIRHLHNEIILKCLMEISNVTLSVEGDHRYFAYQRIVPLVKAHVHLYQHSPTLKPIRSVFIILLGIMFPLLRESLYRFVFFQQSIYLSNCIF